MSHSTRSADLPSWLTIFVVSLTTIACTSTVAVRSPLLQAPLVEMSSATVAIRYADALTSHRCVANRGYIAEAWTIELGPASIEMFNRVFASLFNETIPIGRAQMAAVAGERLPLIEVSLLSYDGCEARWPIVGTTTIAVVYEASLFGKDGARIAHWQGRGRAGADDVDWHDDRGVGGWDIEGVHLAELTRIAMRKAVADFLVKYEKDPAVRAWSRK